MIDHHHHNKFGIGELITHHAWLLKGSLWRPPSMTQRQLVPEALNLRKYEREDSEVTEKSERHLSWPFWEGLPFHALLPPPSTSLTPNPLGWEHQSQGSGLLLLKPGNTNMSIHPEPNRLLETLPYRKVSENQTSWTECFLAAAWHQAVYSRRHSFIPKAKDWPRLERWS